MFERLLCPKADVKLYRNGMISGAAFGQERSLLFAFMLLLPLILFSAHVG